MRPYEKAPALLVRLVENLQTLLQAVVDQIAVPKRQGYGNGSLRFDVEKQDGEYFGNGETRSP